MEFHYVVHYFRIGKSLNNFVSEVIGPCRLYTQKFVVTPLFSHNVNFPIWCQVLHICKCEMEIPLSSSLSQNG